MLAISPLLGLGAYFIIHVALCWTRNHWPRYRNLLIGCLAGMMVMLGATAWAMMRLHADPIDVFAHLLLNMGAYLALAFGYFNFINLNIASLRVRMLEELLEAGGSIAHARLLGEYNTTQVIGLRLDRLTAGGHLLERDGRLVIGAKKHFLLIARLFDGLRWLILSTHAPKLRPVDAPQGKGTS